MSKDYVAHYGIPGQKWGVKHGPPYPLNKEQSGLIYSKDDKVFISGKVKFDEPLSGAIKSEIDKIVNAKSQILIGDAPGADTRVQEYLSSIGYNNVIVYTTDKEVRNNVGNWKVEKIDASKYKDEREARRQKDIAMTTASTKGLAISSEDDRPDSATSLNIQRLNNQNVEVAVWDYKAKKFISPKLAEQNFNSSESLAKNMRSFKYKDFTKLMSPEEVEKTKSGSCHDQVVYAYKELQRFGLKPKAEFVMETDAKGNGGMTHSFIYYERNGKIIWFENAWKERAGLSEYDSLNAIKKEIKNAHLNGEFGSNSKYKDLVFAPFDVPKHKTGESLQQLVDICFDGGIKHMDRADEFLEQSGVKGMRWGIWNEETKQRRLGLTKGHKRYNSGTQDYEAKEARRLTDEELKQRVNRLTQENNYREQLSKSKDADVSRRHKMVQKIFVDSAATAASALMSTIYKNIATSFIKSHFPALMPDDKKKPKP